MTDAARDDPYRFDDAAYVIGALDAGERAAYEAHLTTCADCRASVASVARLPLLLSIAEVEPAGPGRPDGSAADRVPDTLLPRLVRAANRSRRRRTALVATLAGVAAACLAALIVVVWPAGDTPVPPARSRAVALAFTPVTDTPVRVTARLTSTRWGTSIELHCRYEPGTVTRAVTYGLVLYDRSGHPEEYGDWLVPPGPAIDYTTGTALRRAQLSRLEITLADGTPVLRLRL